MYVEQLKDVLKHSCPKRIAGFFAEPIQVRLTTRTQTGKVCNLCYLSLSIPSLFHLPSPVSPFSFSLFLPPPSFSPSFSLLFFLSLFLPPLLSLPLSSSPFFLFRFLPPSISSQGVGGSVQLPKGFLKKAFEAVREKGGLCISDEVGEEEDHTHWAIRTSYLFIFWHVWSLTGQQRVITRIAYIPIGNHDNSMREVRWKFQSTHKQCWLVKQLLLATAPTLTPFPGCLSKGGDGLELRHQSHYMPPTLLPSSLRFRLGLVALAATTGGLRQMMSFLI